MAGRSSQTGRVTFLVMAHTCAAVPTRVSTPSVLCIDIRGAHHTTLNDNIHRRQKSPNQSPSSFMG